MYLKYEKNTPLPGKIFLRINQRGLNFIFKVITFKKLVFMSIPNQLGYVYINKVFRQKMQTIH